jgi:hypothetical protein
VLCITVDIGMMWVTDLVELPTEDPETYSESKSADPIQVRRCLNRTLRPVQSRR